MKINELTTRADLVLNSKVAKAHQQFEKLLSTINQRNIPLPIIERINEIIAELNQTPTKALKLTLRKKQFQLVSILEQELKIVPKNHYRNKFGYEFRQYGILCHRPADWHGDWSRRWHQMGQSRESRRTTT